MYRSPILQPKEEKEEEKKSNLVINFQPQPGPQTWLLSCPIKDILFGGARGGGKTYGSLGHFAAKAHLVATKYDLENSFDGVYVRHTYPELEQLILEAKKIFFGIAEYRAGLRKFVFPVDGPYRGATLQFQHLEKDADTDKFQGKEFQWMCIEEAGQFPIPDPIDKIRATLRSSKGAPKFFLMTANPGGKGHNWLKSRYIDPGPPNKPFIDILKFGKEEFPQERVYIPATLEDNLILMKNDPNYRRQIAMAASNDPRLYKAWLKGDWDIPLSGGMFDDLWDRDTHILAPFTLPKDWEVFRAYDWGSASPFSVGWWAECDGSTATMADGTHRTFAPGTLIRIAEWYGCSDKPNSGLHLLERDIARGVAEREKRWGIVVSDGPADTSIFDVVDGKSLASVWGTEQNISWKRADKSRGSRVHRWQQMRDRLAAAKQSPMEYPGLFVFETCLDWIRIVPASERDERFPEDIDTTTEDHLQDETGYMILYTPLRVRREVLYGT